MTGDAFSNAHFYYDLIILRVNPRDGGLATPACLLAVSIWHRTPE